MNVVGYSSAPGTKLSAELDPQEVVSLSHPMRVRLRRRGTSCRVNSDAIGAALTASSEKLRLGYVFPYITWKTENALLPSAPFRAFPLYSCATLTARGGE